MNKHDPQTIWHQFQQFIASFQTAVIGSLSNDGEPEVSYAPVIQHQACFYIYISELASHTQNLKNHPQAELLFIEDESKTNNLFARERVRLKVIAEIIPRDTEAWTEIIGLFSQQHPQMMALLTNMQDFQLFKLTPQQAHYVAGFAQTYSLTGEQLSEVRQVMESRLKP
ncbi:HugZ family protein [Thiomicrospira sp.]|uniref:HugZ family pyridoxamine 5'-phosphate oxidase n=1 Tax=Thiomicrospira sp. TaxID=935 RepID=UPI002F93B0D7